MSRTGSASVASLSRRSASSRRARPAAPDPRDLERLERVLGRADDRAAGGDPAMAYDLYRDALALQRHLSQPPEEQSRTLGAMASARLAVGELEHAEEHFVAALALTPYDHYALAGACHAAIARGDRATANRLARSAGGDLELLTAAADYAAIEHRDPLAALVLLGVAIEGAPEEVALLQRIAELGRAAGRNREAADATLALAELEPNLERKGRLFLRAGRLVREVDLDLAARCHELALDAWFAPGSLAARDRAAAFEPFADLDRLLSRGEGWVALERSLRAMIRRLPPDDAELPRLWHRLGEVNRLHLDRRDAARKSYEVAAALDVDWMTNQRRLVDLYAESGPGELDKALAARRRLFALEPFDPVHARGLRELFERIGRIDQAYLAARVAASLGGAGAGEELLIRRFRPAQVRWPRAAIGEAHWAALRLPEEDPRITQILGTVAQAIACGQAVAPRKLRVRDVPGAETDAVRGLFGNVARALGLPIPAHVVDPSLEGDVVLANLRQGGGFVPTFVLGRHLLQRVTGAEVAFTVARTLTHGRSAYFLRLLLASDDAVANAWHAALGAAGAGSPRPADDPMGQALARHLDPAWRAQLIGAVRGYLATGGADPIAWCRAVDAVARRVGLLVCGDLEAASAGVHREPRYTAAIPHKERIADLVTFMLSDEHAAIRRDLGLSIG
jgi:tetratricopeptide (TPR) repeat protein